MPNNEEQETLRTQFGSLVPRLSPHVNENHVFPVLQVVESLAGPGNEAIVLVQNQLALKLTSSFN